jgi:ABC-type multidrug transport system ATPase subunit
LTTVAGLPAPGPAPAGPGPAAGTVRGPRRHRAGVEVTGLAKRFGAVQALNEVTLAAPLGSITALVGRNGAGKSTLIRVLATAVRPDRGSVKVCGHDAATDPRGVRRHIGLTLGEDRSFFWRLDGRRNLEFFARLYGLPRRAVAPRVEQVLAAVDLLEVAGRRVDRYSTGMRSRLGIARALLGDPTVLLLDEPTRSLDPAATSSVRGLLRAWLAGAARCAVLATHDLDEAVALADEIVVLRAGTVAACRRPPFDVEEIQADIRGGP